MDPLDPHLLRPTPTLTGPQVASQAGVSDEYADRIFRAIGLPDVPDEAVEFDERDVKVLSALRSILDQGYSEEDVLEVARTYGQALSRVAHTEVRVFRKNFIDPLVQQGLDQETLMARLQEVVPTLLELLEQQITLVHRRHLILAMQQATMLDASGDNETMAVGFVDLVGFSRLAQDLEGEDLGGLISRFETMALEECVDRGVHVVKMIGDAVMFVGADVSAVVAAGLAVVEAAERDEDFPAARAGIDLGGSVTFGGDYFGPPVNIAARLTSFARAGTVVVTAAVIGVLPEGADVSRIGKIRLKGVGEVRAFKVNALSSAKATTGIG